MKLGTFTGEPAAQVHRESFEVFRKNDPFMAGLMEKYGEVEIIDQPKGAAASCKA